MSDQPKYHVKFVCPNCSQHNVLFIDGDRVLDCIKCGAPMPDHIELIEEGTGRRFEQPVESAAINGVLIGDSLFPYDAVIESSGAHIDFFPVSLSSPQAQRVFYMPPVYNSVVVPHGAFYDALKKRWEGK